MAEELGLTGKPELRTIDELLDNDEDYTIVKTVAGFLNTDGFVNWLTTHLVNALGHTSVTRTRARIVLHVDVEICRVDVAASPTPV